MSTTYSQLLEGFVVQWRRSLHRRMVWCRSRAVPIGGERVNSYVRWIEWSGQCARHNEPQTTSRQEPNNPLSHRVRGPAKPLELDSPVSGYIALPLSVIAVSLLRAWTRTSVVCGVYQHVHQRHEQSPTARKAELEDRARWAVENRRAVRRARPPLRARSRAHYATAASLVTEAGRSRQSCERDSVVSARGRCSWDSSPWDLPRCSARDQTRVESSFAGTTATLQADRPSECWAACGPVLRPSSARVEWSADCVASRTCRWLVLYTMPCRATHSIVSSCADWSLCPCVLCGARTVKSNMWQAKVGQLQVAVTGDQQVVWLQVYTGERASEGTSGDRQIRPCLACFTQTGSTNRQLKAQVYRDEWRCANEDTLVPATSRQCKSWRCSRPRHWAHSVARTSRHHSKIPLPSEWRTRVPC